MTSKFRIRLGQIELEYEGNEDFLKKELPELLSVVSKLFQQTGAAALAADPVVTPNSSPGVGGAGVIQLTTGSIAGKLKVGSGPACILAAAAHLSFAKSQQTFTREQLIKEMQSAPTFYKKTYLNNLSAYLGRLTKADKIREISKDTYSLSEACATDLRAKLA